MPDTDPGLPLSTAETPLAAAAVAASAASGGRIPPWLYMVAVSALGALAAAGGGAGFFVSQGVDPTAVGDLEDEVGEHADLEGHPLLVRRVEDLEKRQQKHDRMLSTMRDNQLAICSATGAVSCER